MHPEGLSGLSKEYSLPDTSSPDILAQNCIASQYVNKTIQLLGTAGIYAASEVLAHAADSEETLGVDPNVFLEMFAHDTQKRVEALYIGEDKYFRVVPDSLEAYDSILFEDTER